MITTCTVCQKTFERNEKPEITALALAVGRDTEHPVCYGCALGQLIGKHAPEEGDFNSAHLISGEMSDKEWRWFQEDTGMVKPKWIPEPAFGEDYEDDSNWCYSCIRSIHLCICDDSDIEPI